MTIEQLTQNDIETCLLTPFSEVMTSGNLLWQLSDGTEIVFDGMIHALSEILNTIVYCPVYPF